MQNVRALKNSLNLSSWRAWEQQAYERSGFAAILGAVFALALVFVIALGLFARAFGGHVVSLSLASFILFLGASFALMAVAVLRLNAWKRANPWTAPS